MLVHAGDTINHGPATSVRSASAERRRSVWLSTVLLFTSVILLGSLTYAIANLDRGAENLPDMQVPGPANEGSSAFGLSGQQFQSVCQVTIVLIFSFAFASVLYARMKGAKLGKLISVWELLGYALVIAIFVIIIQFWPSITGAAGTLFPRTGATEPPAHGGAALPPPVSTGSAFLIATIVFAVILIAVYLLARLSHPQPAPVSTARAEHSARTRSEAAGALRRTLLDLEAGRDFRTAVLECYRTMCSILAIRGVSRQDVLTPREIEFQALSELGLSRTSIEDLTSLFEEARYSDHQIGRNDRDRAVECLTAIRNELEGV